jgi:ureidoglycolate hydrolase
LETLRAFEVSDGIGVCLAPTTWHRSVAGLGHDGSFATVTCYAGDPEDIIHFDIPTMTIEEPRK